MIKKLAMLTALLCSQYAEGNSGLLDRVKTPGLLNPNVTQNNVNSTVCVSGYSAKIRPTSNYTNRIKLKQLQDNKYTIKDRAIYELDHFVPLSIGGHPTDERNLWAEPRFGTFNAGDKDVVESGVHRDLCKGKLSLIQAQNIFLGDWRMFLDQYKKQGDVLPRVD